MSKDSPTPELLKLMREQSKQSPSLDAAELIDLLVDLSEVDLPPALMERIRAAKEKLLGPRRGGLKGGRERAAQLRNAPNTQKSRILNAAKTYKGDKRKRASHIAKQLRISGDHASAYVRAVLRKAGQ